jgi:7-keto-8-aminopelargonate synthetase-like enzyme
LNTSFYTLNQLPNRVMQLSDGTEKLYFSGTSYLGVPHNAVFHGFLLEGMARYGTNFGGSRHANMRLAVFEAVETYLAHWSGAAAALAVSSGTLAGQLVMQHIKARNIPIFYAPDAHPALWATVHPYLPKLTFEEWTHQFPTFLSKNTTHIAIASNAIDALRGQFLNFEWINDLPTELQITLILDDSHGIGITGLDGAGIYTMLPKRANTDFIVTASLGKALGVSGGVIFGSRKLIDAIWENPFFGGAAPSVPAYWYAFMQMEKEYQVLRNQLFKNVAYFTSILPAAHCFAHSPNYPIFYTANHALANHLDEQNILLSSFPYPSPESPCVTRIVLSALHTQEDLDRLAGGLQGAIPSLGRDGIAII